MDRNRGSEANAVAGRRRGWLGRPEFRGQSRPRKRRLVLEALEPRCLLAAGVRGTQSAALLAADVPTEVLQDPHVAALDWGGRTVYARRGEWLVKFSEPISSVPPALLDEAGQLGWRALGADGVFLAEAAATADPFAVAASLARLPSVESVEPNFVVWPLEVPNDPSFSMQWSLHNTGQDGGTPDADIDAPEAWNLFTGGEQVVVAVIDSGIDYTHPDLASRLWTNAGEVAGDGVDNDGNGYVDDVHGWDFVDNDNDPYDDSGHGTHVAGIIGAAGNSGLGVTGINWNVRIMPLRIFGSLSQASGMGAPSQAGAIEAINYATMMKRDFGVNVVVSNNSYSEGGDGEAFQAAIEAAGAAGQLFVAAAGNNNGDNDVNPVYPASYDSSYIISVASTDRYDNRSGFSNYGPTTVDLGAPGSGILSTVPGDGYAAWSGTSMAAPQVTGVVALAWSASPRATPAEIRAAVLAGVDPLAALAGITVTGGRLNAAGTLAQLPFVVARTSPGEGDFVAGPPSEFVVDTSTPYDPATLDAGDLTVNGLPAASYTLNDANTITFHFAASPVTAEGLQRIELPASALRRTADGQGLASYAGSFRYDAVRLAVTASTPPGGSQVAVPLTEVTVDFNEPIDPASLDLADLVSSVGTVTGAVPVDADTVRFTLDVPIREGSLQLKMPAGAVSDVHGNPMLAWHTSLQLEYTTVPFPVPLQPISPAGSQVYRGTVSGSVGAAGDTDTFTIRLDGAQVLTLAADPAATLQPTIEVLDRQAISLGTATAVAAGRDAVLQTLAVPTPGVYTIRVSGAGGSAGAYDLQVILNAAVEESAHDGPANDDPASAQDLDLRFQGLGMEASQRAAVVGQARRAAAGYTDPDGFGYQAGAVTPEFVDIHTTGDRVLADVSYDGSTYVLNSDALAGFQFQFYGQPYTSLTIGSNGLLTFGYNPDWSNNGDLTSAPTAATVAPFWDDLLTAGTADAVYWQVLGSGNDQQLVIQWHDVDFYGATGKITFQAVLDEGDGSLQFNYLDLEGGKPAADGGRSATVGIKDADGPGPNRLLVSYDDGPNAYVGTGKSTRIGVGIGLAADFYQFTLQDGESAGLALESLEEGRPLALELWNATGTELLAKGGTGGSLSGAISSFVDATGDSVPDSYLVRVFGEGPYNLVVVRNGLFDTASVGSLPTLLADLTQPGVALGALDLVVGQGLPETIATDSYRLSVSAGDPLVIQTQTPGTGPGEPVNALDPAVRLYAPNGQLVASDDNGAGDGRNARLLYTAAVAGEYTVHVSAAAGVGGDYVLSASGQTGDRAPLTVLSTDLTAGARYMSPPARVSIRVSDAVLLTSLSADDLSISGSPATQVIATEGRTLVFTLPALADGTYTATLAQGAFVDVQGTPLEAFSLPFIVDTQGPRVIASSIASGAVVPAGALTYTARFSEPLLAAKLDVTDVTLVGTLGPAWVPESLAYDPLTSTLTAAFAGLADDKYTLTLRSGDAAFEDLAGNDLDGDYASLPSGNGSPGGNFVRVFYGDAATASFPLPLTAEAPSGSMLRSGLLYGYSGVPNDVDRYTLAVDAGQTIAAVIETESSLKAGLDLFDPSGAKIASVTAVERGREAVLAATSVVAAGTYTLAIRGSDYSTGGYTARLYLNAALEQEEHGGPANDGPAAAQNLDAVFVRLAAGTAQRAGVVGRLGLENPTRGDYFSFHLAPGESAGLALDSSAVGDQVLELFDAAGLLLATGARAANADQVIAGYVAAENGTYYARVRGAQGPFHLVVTRNADFEAEGNDSAASAQEITALGGAVGHVNSDAGDEDWYRIDVSAGATLVVRTFLPGDGPHEPVNNLDPALELYAPDGTRLAADDNSAADGPNARLAVPVAQGGTYRVRVTGVASWGEYVLDVDYAQGIEVGPTEYLTTSESGGQAQFSVVLTSQPADAVTVSLWSSDLTEGRPASASLQFTPDDWQTPQVVTVDGVADGLVDGDVGYTISSRSSSHDPLFDARRGIPVSLRNLDTDTFNSVVVDTASDVLDGNTSSIAALRDERGPDGRTSLREAILAANRTANGPDPDFIKINPLNNPWPFIIQPTSPLPEIVDPVVIDAGLQLTYSQSRTHLVLRGDLAGAGANGLTITAGRSTVRNLIISGFGGAGIYLGGSEGKNTIVGCYLGTTPDGGDADGNAYGIYIDGTSENVIGGSTDETRNVVSGNTEAGILIKTRTSPASRNRIQGNFIGTDVTGAVAVPNGDGVVLQDAVVTEIGGAESGSRNVISGNARSGIWVQGTNSQLNSVFGNWIGLDAGGTGGLANAGDGVRITDGAAANRVGHEYAWGRNVIAHNGGAGIVLTGGPGNAVSGNAIFANAGLGIDLQGDGVTVNDGLQSNGMPNRLMDFPVIAGATLRDSPDAGTLSLSGFVGTVPGQTQFADARVEFFQGDGDPSGHGEGRTYLGYLWTDSNGRFAGSLAGFHLELGDHVTATATDADNNTSEFSAQVAVLPPSIRVTPAGGLTTSEGGGQARFDVVLGSLPISNVTIALTSSDLTEGVVSTGLLTFTPLDWNVPQTVTITGADDFVDDGDVAYLVELGPAASSDPAYDGGEAPDVALVNGDDDTAGISVSAAGTLVTTEAGGAAILAVVLTSEPQDVVEIRLASSDEAEGVLGTTQLLFTSLDWDLPQTVTVQGVNDWLDDGDLGYTVVIEPAASWGDSAYDGWDAPDVAAVNRDDDTAGITVTPPSGASTSEAGGRVTWGLVLTSQPRADVTIDLSSSDLTEGTVAPSSVTFTASNWNVSQTVTATGADDALLDGDVAYTILVGGARSTDAAYSGWDASDVPLTNLDNEEALRLDFGNTSTRTQSGYKAVLPTTVYTAGLGYGWLAKVSGFDRGTQSGTASSLLLQDGNTSTAAGTLQLDLAPNTRYEITVTMGDKYARDRMRVTVPAGYGTLIGGGDAVADVSTAKQQWVHRSFTAQSNATGQLRLQFSDLGGDRYWVVNGLTVQTASRPLAIQGPDGTLRADGRTVDTFTVAGAAPGALYTVSATAGGLVTLNGVALKDADSRYAGVQITAPAGNFTLGLRRPPSAKTATLAVEEVSGAARGSASQVYEAAPLKSSAAGSSSPSAAPLTPQDLQPVVASAIARWKKAGLTTKQASFLGSVQFSIVDLNAIGGLGLTNGTQVLIDDDAVGVGWFVDRSPADEREFSRLSGTQTWVASASSPAAGRVDLLTVIMHELGHVLGCADVPLTGPGSDVMTETLDAGTRRLPTSTNLKQAQQAGTLIAPLTAAWFPGTVHPDAADLLLAALGADASPLGPWF